MNHFLNSSKSHLRQTTSKIEPKAETVAEIKKSTVWKMENELYEFALQQFHFLYKLQHQIKVQGKNLMQKYFYEKIRPKQNWWRRCGGLGSGVRSKIKSKFVRNWSLSFIVEFHTLHNPLTPFQSCTHRQTFITNPFEIIVDDVNVLTST